MAVTRSTPAERRDQRPAFQVRQRSSRRSELIAILIASLLVAAGAGLTYRAKTLNLTESGTLNLNTIERAEQLLPVLSVLPTVGDRQYVSREIFNALQTQIGRVGNVGTLGRIRVPVRDVLASRAEGLKSRAPEDRSAGASMPLLTQQQLALIKPSLVVRTAAQFRNQFLLWIAALFGVIYLAHFVWTLRGFRGEQSILPALQALTGVGFVLMLSLRDPIRDTLAFSDFAQSVLIGGLLMTGLVFVDFVRPFARLSYTFLLGAVLLSIALIAFGSGPGVSDAKVNLLGFQPVELIKILIVFFLAGYFANRWEFLRVLKERRDLGQVSKLVDIPRLEYLMPVLAAVGLTLVFFFLQKDLGPALIISCLFLAMYFIARGRAPLAVSGLALILAGFLTGYFLKYPRTVYSRVSMWLSPWDNLVRGGEQVVHSLWAMATGSAFGTGLGLGDSNIMPAAHTDLILAVLGEEWGFVGLLVVYALYAVLIYTGLRVAMKASSDYAFFLAIGLTLLVGFGAILISGGVLDLLPLSGVVTPFLSYGGTAMLANFVIFGILLSLSTASERPESTQPFRQQVRGLALLLVAAGIVIIGKAAWIQLIRPDAIAGAGALTVQADGFRRYQYNPRLLTIARGIPRGTIYDRNGLPLATSDAKLLEQHKQSYARLGIDFGAAVDPTDTRHYPLGARSVHFLGDLRSRANWGARNSSLVERDSMIRLQGYNDRAVVVEVPDPRTGKPAYTVRHDYRELLPVLRHRHEPDHPEVKKLTERERDIKTSIDARLQMRTSRLLEARLKKLGKQKGAAVVMDPETGDLLASVSYPWPDQMPPALGPDDGIDEMLDRARYGLYPPGSTFKLVTAMGALRKDPALAQMRYECKPLPDGRVGNFVKGWGRPIRDDIADRSAHGSVDMQKGTVVSCNAYYAQLGTYSVGAEALHATAKLFGIATAVPDRPDKLRDALPQASYGQGQVVASPFQMARVAATVAQGGSAPQGRWIIDETNARVEPPQVILSPAMAARLGEYMRGVMTSGTGRSASSSPVAIAGKTGTAELENKPSHAWFIGYAPHGGTRKLAFAVLVENGQYGGSAAAPIAADIMAAAAELGLFTK